MRNNIALFKKELEEYTSKSIKGAYFDKWKFNYLQERLRSEILSVRLYYCKNDNNKLKKQYIDTIKALAHDENDAQRIRSVSDIAFELDKHLAIFITSSVKKFKKANNGIPNSILEEFGNNESLAIVEYNKRLDFIIEAFALMGGDKVIYSKEERNVIEKGKQWFVEYFESLWV